MPMEKYRLEIAVQFDHEIHESVDYIASKFGDPMAANKLAHDIYEAIENRLYYPTSLGKFNDNYYVINVRNRQIFYTVDEKRKIMTVEFIRYRGWNG